jgi:hypothetical protein
MALYQPEPVFIDEEIRSVIIDGITFRRFLRYCKSTPDQNPETGEMSVILIAQVRHYLVNQDGTLGAYAPKLVPSYFESFRADNTEAIDTATGEIVLTRLLENDEQWLALLEADARTLIQRGDAYALTMHSGPVDMVPQIREAMRAADGAPYWRFGGRPEPSPEPEPETETEAA